MMARRKEDFPQSVKEAAFARQAGLCGACGVKIFPPRPGAPRSPGMYPGEAHHLKPVKHGGDGSIDNCIYLCYAHHKLLGHGMAPFGIDKQGGSSRHRVLLTKGAFPYWEKER